MEFLTSFCKPASRCPPSVYLCHSQPGGPQVAPYYTCPPLRGQASQHSMWVYVWRDHRSGSLLLWTEAPPPPNLCVDALSPSARLPCPVGVSPLRSCSGCLPFTDPSCQLAFLGLFCLPPEGWVVAACALLITPTSGCFFIVHNWMVLLSTNTSTKYASK